MLIGILGCNSDETKGRILSVLLRPRHSRRWRSIGPLAVIALGVAAMCSCYFTALMETRRGEMVEVNLGGSYGVLYDRILD
jgi:hypothetical protein